MTATLSVIIPTRNAASGLARLLPQLVSCDLDIDVIVCDGGSTDRTVDIAMRHQARITAAEGGRGAQLRAGTELVYADWVLLLHADSILPQGWEGVVRGFIDDAQGRDLAGYFRFTLDDDHPSARRLERIVAWRSRVLGLPYGDQGLLISRGFLDRLGGVPALPLMEDVALVRKIGRGRLVALEQPLITSAEKFQRDGYLRRSARNLACLALYYLGIPARLIRKIYG